VAVQGDDDDATRALDEREREGESANPLIISENPLAREERESVRASDSATPLIRSTT